MRRRRAGVTTWQASAAVAVVGCLLAAFLPTFFRELRLSKVSEAPELLATMHDRAAAYFLVEHPSEPGPARRCLPAAAGPTPAEPSEAPVEVAFGADEVGGASWTALGFLPDRPVRFSYTFEPVTAGCGLRSPERTFLATFRAQGDLDGDGLRSTFERRAAADPETGELVPVGILYVRDRVE